MASVSKKDLIEKMSPLVDELGGYDVSTPGKPLQTVRAPKPVPNALQEA